jgi:hypothetical protein
MSHNSTYTKASTFITLGYICMYKRDDEQLKLLAEKQKGIIKQFLEGEYMVSTI